jgi:hypothetical protein
MRVPRCTIHISSLAFVMACWPSLAQTDVLPEVGAYRELQGIKVSKERLAACQDFVGRFPGKQLALRVMREAADLYILQEARGRYHPLETCANWMGGHLKTPAWSWQRYRNAPNSVFLDRIETHLAYARILAGSRTYNSRSGKPLANSRTYNRALKELAIVVNEAENRPELMQQRSDLVEQMRLTRCWCLHGKEDYLAALSSYERFIDGFPNSDFTPAALLNAGSCLRALERRGAAAPRGRQKIAAYHQRLLEEFPGSAEAVKLRQSLQPRR